MSLHPSGFVLDPARVFEDAVRAARATSHARRLDAATQAALNAYADALTAATDYLRLRDAALRQAEGEIARLAARMATIEALESRRVHSDP